MMNFKRGCWAPVTVLLSVVLASCGGNAPGSDSTSSTGGSSGTGSTTTTAANVVPVTVDAGPTGVNATNSLSPR